MHHLILKRNASCLSSAFCHTDHCMVSFIKKNLLGSMKEFRNRFINPIQNGQCADSTPKDVRIMKKRAHVLHAMLVGCVHVRRAKCSLSVHAQCGFLSLTVTLLLAFQRRDYSELTQFLPPKHEYVLAVRICPLQYKLYRYYLEHITGKILSLHFYCEKFTHTVTMAQHVA